jgi:membrane associated rhomboid family serine protease
MVIPLRDIHPRQNFPAITVGLIGLNALLFFYELSLGRGLSQFFLENAFIPVQYFEPGNWFADARALFLSMFLHGGWSHLLGNMLYLWIFGDNIEDHVGRRGFVAFYLFCGWFATMAHAYTNADSAIPTVGASGAISGVLGAYLVMFPHTRVLTLIPLGYFIRITELPALIVLGMWFVLQLFSGTLSLGGESGGVAWFAHIGGFVAGMVLGFIFKRGGLRPTVPRDDRGGNT